MSVEGCLACDLADGRLPLPGGRVHETDHWLVEHCIGPLGVGTLIVKPRRHVVHVADLDEAEAKELGPLLWRVAATVTELTDPEQVYVTLWSHTNAVPGPSTGSSNRSQHRSWPSTAVFTALASRSRCSTGDSSRPSRTSKRSQREHVSSLGGRERYRALWLRATKVRRA